MYEQICNLSIIGVHEKNMFLILNAKKLVNDKLSLF